LRFSDITGFISVVLNIKSQMSNNK